ncbi:MAG: YihY/virulence factor BrkB family protein [Bacilli bacterium]|nr:YihY/virulence factor BrkB family protein [Bacilli bacterium]
MERVRVFMRKAKRLFKEPQMRVLPGQLAFFFVLSFIPLLALVANVCAYFGLSLNSIKEVLASSLAGDLADKMINIVSGKGLNWNILVFFISAAILASNGAHSVIIASNEIYKVKDRGIVKRRLKAIGMTFLLVGLLLFLLVVPVFGKQIFALIRDNAANQDMVSLIYNVYTVLKYPVAIIVVYLIVKFIYIIAPDQKVKSHTTTIGSLFTAVGWAITTYIYSFYVDKFAHYDLLYGSISNLIILFLWVYILAYVFVLGMIINASNSNEQDLRTQVIKLFKD